MNYLIASLFTNPALGKPATVITGARENKSYLKTAGNDKINIAVGFAITGPAMKPITTSTPELFYTDDPEILSLSASERRSLALSASGMWSDRDDMDDVREAMNNASWDRLDELYGHTK